MSKPEANEAVKKEEAVAATPVSVEKPPAAAVTATPEIPFVSESLPCKYRQIKLLGQGSTGPVYLVRRTSDNAPFAAKVLDLTSMSERRRRYARNESRCLEMCHHPFVIGFGEYWANNDRSVLVMELADARDLHSHMKYMRKAFAEREAGILFAQLLLGVQHVHSRKIVHRDIKSSNVFLCASGLVKLGDFGFSKQQENTIATGGTFLGTPFYLSPEMWLGKKNGRKADTWALGVVLYEMLCNRRPFLGDDTQSLRAAVISNTREPVGPNVSRDMVLLVNSMLEPDVTQRPKCIEVLATPIMQHYVELLAAVVARDQALPAVLRDTILQSITDLQQQVEDMKQRALEDPGDCRYEGAVLKESGNQTWKERYLTLNPTELTLSLPASRVSAPGADRSRSMPVSTIDFVCPSSEASAADRFAFEVMFDTGYTLLLATKTQREREIWIGKILTAVDMSAT